MPDYYPPNEQILHFLWRERSFSTIGLYSNEGESITINFPGYYNRNAGPDFREGRIQIGPIHLAGSIEIHRKSSEWYQHRHQLDPLYDSTILHVVWQHDRQVYRTDGTPIPTLVLKPYVNHEAIKLYHKLLLSEDIIPCTDQITEVDKIYISDMIDTCGAERLMERSIQLERLHQKLDYHWERLLWVSLGRYFGFGINNDCFELLTRNIPFHIVQRCIIEKELEALLMGMAGFLRGTPTDYYQADLKNSFLFLKNKYTLDNSLILPWKWMRTRPSNFPVFRMAQLCAIVQENSDLFLTLIEYAELSKWRKILRVPSAEYWKTHFHFGKTTSSHSNCLGTNSVDLITINCLSPLLFYYSERTDREDLKEKAVMLQQEIKPESNRNIRGWGRRGIVACSSYESQGLLQLYQMYCSKKLCLDCKIGTRILRN